MTGKQLLLLGILYQEDYSITTREVFDKLTDGDKTKFSGMIENASSVLVNLRKAGLVENGVSEIINGQTRLTWRITDKGSKEIDSIIKDDEMPSDLMDLKTHTQPEERYSVSVEISDLNTDEQQVVIDLVKLLESKKPVPAVEINDLDLKVTTLRNLAPMLSTDIHDVLMNIVDDLEGMEK